VSLRDGRDHQHGDRFRVRGPAPRTINLSATLNPTNHLNLALVSQRWVNVADAAQVEQLFISRLARGAPVHAACSFGIARCVSTRDPASHRSDNGARGR
jgi:hypothetical protein